MNSLEKFIVERDLDEANIMNELQMAGGLISDNAVRAADVSPSDSQRAVEFLVKFDSTP